MDTIFFKNRIDAGKQLAQKLLNYKGEETVIYALPRGGVVVGFEISKTLEAPLDLIITRKIGHQYNPEFAMCAISEDQNLICNEGEVALADPVWLKSEIDKETKEIERRRLTYTGEDTPISPNEKLAIVVDDGIATGLTMRSAIAWIKSKKPSRIIMAVPVIPKEIANFFENEVDFVASLNIPEYYLGAVSAYYDEFEQISDEEVINLIGKARKRHKEIP